MNWLARLKEKEKGPGIDTTKPTKGAFVGFVGTHSPLFPESGGEIQSEASNDPGMPADLRQSGVTEIFDARQALLMDRGLSTQEAEAAAVMLERRDANRDERRLCLECSHMFGSVDARRCSQWRQLGDPSPAMPADLVGILRRCRAFQFKMEIPV